MQPALWTLLPAVLSWHPVAAAGPGARRLTSCMVATARGTGSRYKIHRPINTMLGKSYGFIQSKPLSIAPAPTPRSGTGVAASAHVRYTAAAAHSSSHTPMPPNTRRAALPNPIWSEWAPIRLPARAAMCKYGSSRCSSSGVPRGGSFDRVRCQVCNRRRMSHVSCRVYL